jgi:hypothetical protein
MAVYTLISNVTEGALFVALILWFICTLAVGRQSFGILRQMGARMPLVQSPKNPTGLRETCRVAHNSPAWFSDVG